MKYYLTYLNEEGESTKIELSNLPFFKDKSAGKILNIIAFYNQFDTPEDMLEYLYGKGLVDKSATADFRIVIKRKNKYDKEYYQIIPHSDIPLVSCTRQYFDKSVLKEVIIKKLKDNDFVVKLRKEFGYIKDYTSNTQLYSYLAYIAGYNKENHEFEREAAEEYERCVRKSIKVLFDSPKIYATLAMFTIDYVTPKELKVPFRKHYLEEQEFEEFLEVDDIVRYNPGLTGKALEEALEEEELFKEAEWERQKKNMGM